MILARIAILLSLVAGAADARCSDAVADFRWDGGQARFTVEIADDEAERAQGLMYRERLASGAGMLFVYDHPQPVSFWMMNTLIPLDMIFIGADGEVLGVHANAVPGDTTAIPGPRDTLMVLEISGGLAERLGLAKGAQMRHPRIDPDKAVWRCPPPKTTP